MAIVAQYTPSAMPKDYKTTENHYTVVKHKDGSSELKQEVKESSGGVLFTFPRGHSIRLTSQAQIDRLGLGLNPKLIDTDSGEECDERGVPLSLQQYVKNAAVVAKGDFGLIDAEDTE